MRFTSDIQRRAVFARLNCGSNRFSELPDWAKKFTEPSTISVVQTKISNEPISIKGFAAQPYDARRFMITTFIKEHPEIKSNPQVAVDNITLINVLMDYAEENGIESLGDIDWDDIRSGGTYNELRGSMGLARKKKFEQMRLSLDQKSREERIADIDRVISIGGLTDVQKDMFTSLRKNYVDSKLSKHPKSIGSVWEGDDYVHGPRIRQPEDFSFIKTVEPEEKYYHFEGSSKIPKTLPRGSKLVIGKLRESGGWALQSTLIPKSSGLGKNLLRR